MNGGELREKIYEELKYVLSESYGDKTEYLVFTLKNKNKEILMNFSISNVAEDIRKSVGQIYYKDVYDYIIKHYLKKKIELL